MSKNVTIQEVIRHCFLESKGDAQKFMFDLEKHLDEWDCKYVGPRGYVYVIGWEGSKYVKIGFSGKPEKRLAAMQTGHPETLRLEATIACDKPTELERSLHQSLEKYRAPGKSREWFERTAAMGVVNQYKDGTFVDVDALPVSQRLEIAGFKDPAYKDLDPENPIYRWLLEQIESLPNQAYFSQYYSLYGDWCAEKLIRPQKAISFSKYITGIGAKKIRRNGENGWWMQLRPETA